MRILGRVSQHLSQASILILAGFLIGFSLSGFVLEGPLRTQILNCGVAGLISVVGLHVVARYRRQTIVTRVAEEEAVQALQVVRCLNSLRQSLQEKARELEGRSGAFTLPDSRRSPPAAAGHEAQTS